MSNRIRSNVFIVAFLLTSCVFVAVNYYDYSLNDWCRRVADCGWSFGIPFDLYEAGTILHFDNILWFGLFADVAVAIIASGLVGWMIDKIRTKHKPS